MSKIDSFFESNVVKLSALMFVHVPPTNGPEIPKAILYYRDVPTDYWDAINDGQMDYLSTVKKFSTNEMSVLLASREEVAALMGVDF
jgi:hypothetical protein